jgi:copper oxidase (laccase) domain-containing protein
MPGLASEARPGHAFFDGWACAHEQVRDAGVPVAQIFAARLCTASHGVLCSYRRDGVDAGRIAGAIMPVSRA